MLEKLKTRLLLVCVVYFTVDGVAARHLVNPLRHELFELSIVHINDFHARFVQTSPTSSTCHQGKEDQCIGGLGRLMTVTRQLFQERKNAIFLNAGDVYQGTLWYNLFKWNVTAYFMNELPHDAMTIGNHEFDDGVAGLVPFLQQVRAPVVAANIDASEEPTMQGLYKNSTIIVRDNQTIGVIGVIVKTTNTLSKSGKLKFLDEVKTVNSEAQRLRARGVNIIIVLSHAGLDVDKKIATESHEVDVIVGGHTHVLLYSGNSTFVDEPADKYPVVVKQNATDRSVLIVHAGAFNKYVGNLTVWFDRQGEVANWEGNPIFLNSSIQQDPETMKELQPWTQAVDARSNRIIGETRTPLNRRCDTGECNMANLISDAMVHYYKNKTDDPEHWTYASIGCMNAGGIRSGMPVGDLTYGDLKSVQPFESTWNVVEIKGDDLRMALEECVTRSSYKDYFAFGGLLHCSGIKVSYNMSMPAWSRVADLTVRCQACKEPKFEPLDRDKWYRLVVSNFILNKGDGLTIIASKHRNFELGPVDIDAFTEFVEFMSPINYEIDHRLMFVGKSKF